MTILKIQNLSVKFGEYEILKDISFNCCSGQWIMLIGPNGAGKSTTLSALSRSIKYSGKITIDDVDIQSFKNKEYAKRIGFLDQNHNVSYAFTVHEIVELGRYAYEKTDDEIVDNALRMTGLETISNQSVMTLSGGELQRAFLAQLIAQNPEILVLDEPTNHLDLQYQKEVFELLNSWLKNSNCIIVSVVHDLSLAKAFGTHAVLLNNGEILHQGVINDVMNPKLLNESYGIDVYDWMKNMYGQWK